jgi:hypothetical protein
MRGWVFLADEAFSRMHTSSSIDKFIAVKRSTLLFIVSLSEC